jgi:hypothetical protein
VQVASEASGYERGRLRTHMLRYRAHGIHFDNLADPHRHRTPLVRCPSMKKQPHRKVAKNAKCLTVFVKESLCVLRVSAMNAVFMYAHYSSLNPGK